MEEQQPGFIEKYRSLVKQYNEELRAYKEGLHNSPLYKALDDVDKYAIPAPVTNFPKELTSYYKLRELKMEVVRLEKARERIVKSVEYRLKCIEVDKPIDTEEYRKTIHPFKHCKAQIQLAPHVAFPFQNPHMFEYFAEQAANGLFDMSGGDFSAVQAECTNGRLTVYLIK
jgi:hypothetical protein